MCIYIYIDPKYLSILLESIRCFREATRSLRPPNLSSSVRVCRSSTWTRRTWKRLESPEISASGEGCDARRWSVMIVMMGVIYFLWFVMGKSNQWLHADKPDKLKGWFRKVFIFPDLFFVKCCGYGSWHGWVQVNIVPYTERPRIDQWNFRTPSSVEKIWEKLSFLQIIPENNRLDSLKLKWPESWFPESWDVGHGYVKLSTIYQPSGDMLVYPGCFFFIRSWQALVSFDQSFFGLFFFVWPVWRGLSCAKNPAKGIDWRVRLPSEENHGNLFSRKSEKTDLSVTRLWQHLVWNIYIYIFTYVYNIVYVFGISNQKIKFPRITAIWCVQFISLFIYRLNFSCNHHKL